MRELQALAEEALSLRDEVEIWRNKVWIVVLESICPTFAVLILCVCNQAMDTDKLKTEVHKYKSKLEDYEYECSRKQVGLPLYHSSLPSS